MPILELPNKLDRLQYFGSTCPINGVKPTDKQYMPDLQNIERNYFFKIDNVGIKKIKYPVIVKAESEPVIQQTIGEFTLTTELCSNKKGINMSRLPEILQEAYSKGIEMNPQSLRHLAKRMAERMEQKSSAVQVSFPWFFERTSPVLGMSGLMSADVNIEVCYQEPAKWKEKIGMIATVTTLCPCSKEISEYSAHNQRGIVSIEIETYSDRSFPRNFKEIMLEVIESNASAKLYSILKRPDEKKVTEQAFENPRFVEDLIRLVAADLYELRWVQTFHIECRNEESIHLHDAYASLSYDKEKVIP
ncbi:GTP cyclohydrolase FolE2 [Bacillus sp. AFS017274]|uniref:GTP cyclohydrolase FolE2 n=1 Tax=Bacillaceae TaxID=186817 RepID=UPI000BFA0BD4|nr:GTP cyclohydrolase FolE2 [Bacillus sp. AFS017274]PEZ71469.1 GTP cyclohydrolase I FolE2 [Bacillus sp. AFS017274]